MPGVGVGIIILNKENKVLLILRNENPELADSAMRLEGTWTLPAGKVKYGEILEEAAQRKVKEETNLDVDDLKIVSIADDINSYAHFVTIGFSALKVSGKIDLGSSLEHVAYAYFPLDNLPDNTCAPSLKILDNYLNKRVYKR